MRELSKNPLFYLSIVLVLILSFQIAGFVGAFTEPTEPFPGGEPAVPLDTSGVEQTKNGTINLGRLSFTDAGSGLCLRDSGGTTNVSCRIFWDQFATGGGSQWTDLTAGAIHYSGGFVGIGTSNLQPNTPLYIRNSVSGVAQTSNLLTLHQRTTGGQMQDGLSSGIRFLVEDVENIPREIGMITVERSGSDSSGLIKLRTRENGVLREGLTIAPSGEVTANFSSNIIVASGWPRLTGPSFQTVNGDGTGGASAQASRDLGAHDMCFLNRSEVQDCDNSNSWCGCEVKLLGGTWKLSARALNDNDAAARCEAYCVDF